MDRKTEIIQSEKEKKKSHPANNKAPRPKTSLGDQSEKESRIIGTKEKACLLRALITGRIRDGKKGKRGQEGMIRISTRGVGRYRDQSKPRARPKRKHAQSGRLY